MVNKIQGEFHLNVDHKKRLLLIITFTLLSFHQAKAVDWNGNSNNWNTPGNWSTGNVPSVYDNAVFGNSMYLDISLSAPTNVGTITFNQGASAFIFSTGIYDLQLGQQGIQNNSSNAQTFNIPAYGTIVFQDNASAGSNVTYNTTGSLGFFGSSSAQDATIIMAAGSRGGFEDASTAANASITNAGSININGTVTAGNATITNNTGGQILFDNTATAGSATITNAGTLSFSTESSAGSATLNNLAAGNITFQNGSNAGNAKISNAGTLKFSDNATAGNAAISNAAGATLDLTDLGADINIGSLSGAGNIQLGSNILATGALNQDTTLSGIISGTGELIKEGKGILTLTGSNSYTGATTVKNGGLVNNGALSSTVSVNSGATYSGNGSSLSLTNAGTVSPTSTLTINGNYTQNPTGTYAIGLGSTSSSSLNISGSASLNGALNINVVGNMAGVANKTYIVLTAGQGVTGRFANVSAPPVLKYVMKYLANNVIIDVEGVGFALLATRGDPVHLDALVNTHKVTPDFHHIVHTLVNVSRQGPKTLSHAIYQLSPDVYRELGFLSFNQSNLARETTRNQQHKIIDTFFIKEFSHKYVSPHQVLRLQSVTKQGPSLRSPLALANERRQKINPAFGLQQTEKLIINNIPICHTMKVGKSNVWIEPFGQLQHKKNSRQRAGTKGRTYGTSAGIDTQVLQNTYLGLMGGLMNTPFHWQQNRGKGKVSNTYGGLYGLWMSKTGLYFDAQAVAGATHYRTHRRIIFDSINRTAHQSHKGYNISTDVEAGYVIALNSTVLQPYFNMGYAAIHENRFSERGAGSVNIRRPHKTSQFLRSELGSLFSQVFVYEETLIYPSLNLSWVQKRPIGSGKSVNYSFENQTVMSSVRGDNRIRNLFKTGLSLTSEFKNGLYCVGNISGEVGNGERSGELMLTLGYNF